VRRVLALSIGILLATAAWADTGTIALPKPDMRGGKPLMQCLAARHSTRSFAERAVPLKTLGNLCWAAWGINRPATGGRTAPSAMNKQEIDLFVARRDGLFLYDAKAHALKRVSTEDVRALTGRQPFVATAPLNLIYVADLARTGMMGDKQMIFAAADAGFIGQNVYLYCASAGLACVVRAGYDEEKLPAAMGLRPEQKIILCHSVGFPK